MDNSPYNAAFYDDRSDGSERSAERVLGVVWDVMRPVSVVDVGCGIGNWAHVAQRMGTADVLGVDGPYVERGRLRIPDAQFLPADLSQPLRIGRTFDLVICMEVAEHLPESSADGFVRSLCSLAPVVLFSAAIPGQRGTHHVNEQWPDYWSARFEANGFLCLDVIRDAVWDAPDVDAWYAQNSFLYARADHVKRFEALPGPRTSRPVRKIHPKLYASLYSDYSGLQTLDQPPRLPWAIRALKKSAVASVRHHLKRSK